MLLFALILLNEKVSKTGIYAFSRDYSSNLIPGKRFLATYIVAFRISEWILATPLTA